MKRVLVLPILFLSVLLHQTADGFMPVWLPEPNPLETERIAVKFIGFWLMDSLDVETKLLTGTVRMENKTEETLEIGPVTLLAGDTRFAALSSTRVQELWDGSLPEPRPDNAPEIQSLKARGLVGLNIVGRALLPSTTAFFTVSFAVCSELPPKLTMEFDQIGSIRLRAYGRQARQNNGEK